MQIAREMPRPILHALAKCWWLLLLRGLAAIAFGVLALAAAFTGGAKPVPTWWLVVVGLLGIAAGAVTFLWPGITAILLVLFIGAWALVHGIFEIIGAIQLRKGLETRWMRILAGAYRCCSASSC